MTKEEREQIKKRIEFLLKEEKRKDLTPEQYEAIARELDAKTLLLAD
jgi:hypothetical protein